MFLAAAVTLSQPVEPNRVVTLATAAQGLELSGFHEWTVELPPGPPAALVQFEATMPAHGHGLASQPRLRRLGPRRIQIEGVRFHMTGAWQLRVRYQDAAGSHDVTFPFEVRFATSQLRSLWLGARGPVRPDPTNRFAGRPDAEALGRELFFDRRLSGDGSTSCATCHQPETAFADRKQFSKPGLARNTQGLLGVSESPWLFWDGRRDSLWSQALLPIESPAEMGGSRAAVAALLRGTYRDAYLRVAGAVPESLPVDRLFADAGKFIAAYERTLQPGPSRFDRYVEELEAGRADTTALSADEAAGLRIFFSPEARCTQCHNGPLFTNQGFHNIGTGKFDGDYPDFGRAAGIHSLAFDAFNCRGVFSDARSDCPSLDFARQDGHDGRLTGAFKVPSLRNVALTAPYLHDGSLPAIEAVIEHYRHPQLSGASEILPLRITDDEARQLAAFLRTLTSIKQGDGSAPQWRESSPLPVGSTGTQFPQVLGQTHR